MTNEKQEALMALEEIENAVYHNEGDGIYDGSILSTDGLHVIISKETVDTIRAALTEAPKVDIEGLKKQIPVGEEYEEPDPTDMYAAAPFENGMVLGFARGYNAAIDHITTHYDLVKKERRE